jgi:hypothetical protein
MGKNYRARTTLKNVSLSILLSLSLALSLSFLDASFLGKSSDRLPLA